MKYHLLLILTIVGTFLAACGPDARYPIDSHPVVKIDKRLFGKWILTERKDGDVQIDSDIVYAISKQSGYEYHILIRAKKEDKYEVDSTTAYLSVIDKEPFVNIYLRGDPDGYIFLKILTIDADKITATGLADTMTVTSAAQVRQLIAKNLNSPAFYKDTVEFNRVK